MDISHKIYHINMHVYIRPCTLSVFTSEQRCDVRKMLLSFRYFIDFLESNFLYGIHEENTLMAYKGIVSDIVNVNELES